uniref:Zinc-ribbon 15 domain-containing protein n=1 Tax=Manihot esculenta TaxID=3983 RepID=A0A2C9U278_MANES
MFFFFVGGVEQQVRQVLKSGVGRCINCGFMADLVEYDKVLKLFFVPVWKWPAKDPAVYCNNCSLMFPRSFSLPPPNTGPPAIPESLRCRFCDRVAEPEFRFCPFCGSSL